MIVGIDAQVGNGVVHGDNYRVRKGPRRQRHPAAALRVGEVVSSLFAPKEAEPAGAGGGRIDTRQADGSHKLRLLERELQIGRVPPRAGRGSLVPGCRVQLRWNDRQGHVLAWLVSPVKDEVFRLLGSVEE